MIVGKTKLPQYVSTIEPRVLSILKAFNLVFEEAKGSGELRKYFAYLTTKGKEIAREIIAERISSNSSNLKKLINDFGKIAAILAIGTVDIIGKEPIMRLKIGEPSEIENIKNEILQLYADRVVREGKVYEELVKRGFKINFDYSTLVKKDSVTNVHPLIQTLCHFLVYYRYEDSFKIFKELESLVLAVEVPVYGSRGQYVGEEARAPLEVGEFILNEAKISFDEGLLREFGALMIIYNTSKIRDPYTARRKFEDYLRFYEIPPNTVEKVLDDLNKLGLTSKYINLPESAPFLVLDQRFEEEVKRRIYSIAERFLSA